MNADDSCPLGISNEPLQSTRSSNTPRTSDAQSNKVGPIHQLGSNTFAQMFWGLYLCANKALIHILVTTGYSVYVVKF